MFDPREDLALAINNLRKLGDPFDFNDISKEMNRIIDDSNKFRDELSPEKFKEFILNYFEAGNIPEYTLSVQLMVDTNGPYSVFIFTPVVNNGISLNEIYMVDTPNPSHTISCKVSPACKGIIEYIAKLSNCSQDKLIRSVLMKSLEILCQQIKNL